MNVIFLKYFIFCDISIIFIIYIYVDINIEVIKIITYNF